MPPVAVLVPPVDVVVPPVLVVLPPVILVFTVLSLPKSLPFDAVVGLTWLTVFSLLVASPILMQLGEVPQSVEVVASANAKPVVDMRAAYRATAVMFDFFILVLHNGIRGKFKFFIDSEQFNGTVKTFLQIV